MECMKKYLEIIQFFESQIDQGNWLPGEKLPSIRKTAADLQCSIGTVQHAYEMMEDRRLLVSKDRSGFYVQAQDFPEWELKEEPVFESDPGPVNILETAIEVMERKGTSITYGLGSAMPYLNPAMEKSMQKALVGAARRKPNHYEGPQGYFPLRREIARRSIRAGRAIPAEDLMISSGCQESLFLALQVSTEPGDLVLVESPCYYGLLQTLEIMNRRVLEIPVCPQRGMDLNLLETLLQKHSIAAMVINSSFSNPTGFTYSDEDKERVCRLFCKRGIPIIEDDVFAELSFSESRPRSIHSFDTEGNVLLCSSFSKTLSQDLRVGWLEPGRYFKEARAYKYVSTLGTPAIQQYALAEYLSTRQYERHLRTVRQVYRAKQRVFLNGIRTFFPDETKVSTPRGGFLAWLKLNSAIDSRDLYRKALSRGVEITPGFLFSPGRRFDHYIRLNWGGLERNQMEKGLEILASLL